MMCRSVRREDSTRLEHLFWFETYRNGIEHSRAQPATVLVCFSLTSLRCISFFWRWQQIENWVFFLFISLIRAGSPMFFGTGASGLKVGGGLVRVLC